MVDLADLARRGLHHGLADGDLAVTGDGDAVLDADADHGGGADSFVLSRWLREGRFEPTHADWIPPHPALSPRRGEGARDEPWGRAPTASGCELGGRARGWEAS